MSHMALMAKQFLPINPSDHKFMINFLEMIRNAKNALALFINFMLVVIPKRDEKEENNKRVDEENWEMMIN